MFKIFKFIKKITNFKKIHLSNQIITNINNLRRTFHNKSDLYETIYPEKFSEKEIKNDLYDLFLNNKNMDIHKVHHYFEIYDKHFSVFRNKPVTILEIGVYKGGSLKLWKKYFGSKAIVHGIDINPKTKEYADPSNKIYVHIGDQSDPAFLAKLMDQISPIDIIIDDGGHTTTQQIQSFISCYRFLSKNGIYLCEDLQTNMCPDFIDSNETFIDFSKKNIDMLYAFYNCPKKFLHYQNRDCTPIPVPLFSSITKGIYFYDSIIVYERGVKKMPYIELR